MHPPFNKSWMIDGGRMIGGQYPGTLDPVEHRAMLHKLMGFGITHIINLQHEDETASGIPFRDYMPLARPIAAELGQELGFRRFAIEDQGTPTAALMTDCLDHLDAILRTGGRPYIHCWGGSGRTGTVIGCWLVRQGRKPDDAIEEMRQGRLGRGFTFPAPENSKQRQFIADWPTTDPELTKLRRPPEIA